MYNPQKIKDLLDAGGYKYKDLLLAMGKTWNGAINGVIKGDIRVSKLEQIADFFGVSTDCFFIRDPKKYNPNAQKSITQIMAESQEKELVALRELVAEKDKRIQLLELYLDLLKKNQTNQQDLGQNSDK